MTDNVSPENEETPQKIYIKCPPALSDEEFRSRLLAETISQFPDVAEKTAEATGLDPAADAKEIEDIIYQEGLRGLFEDIADARIDGDTARLQQILIFRGFTTKKRPKALTPCGNISRMTT